MGTEGIFWGRIIIHKIWVIKTSTILGWVRLIVGVLSRIIGIIGAIESILSRVVRIGNWGILVCWVVIVKLVDIFKTRIRRVIAEV